jgi:hypothetical protein
VEDASATPAVFPYSLLLDVDTDEEEAIAVLSRNVGANTLAVTATVRAHSGPAALFWSGKLDKAAPVGRTFLLFPPLATRVLPYAGWLRLDPGDPTDEVVEYTRNDVGASALYLKKPLTQVHAKGSPVDLVRPGALMRTCTVLQEGIHWQLYTAPNRTALIYLPPEFLTLGARDAHWFHDRVPQAFATTLAAGCGPTDLTLTLTSVAGLPDEAALVEIAGQRFFYYERDEAAVPNPKLYLPEAVGFAFPAGTTVILYEVPYATAPRLEDGNIRDAGGELQPDRFAGHYVYDPRTYAPGEDGSPLAVEIPFPTEFAADMDAGRVCAEAVDLSRWLTSGYDVRLARATGAQEDRTVVGKVLRRDVATAVLGAHAPTATTLAANPGVGAGTNNFPASASPLGHRLIIGTVPPTTVKVQSNDVATDVWVLEAAIGVALAGAETIELMADVLEVSVGVSHAHHGEIVGSDVEPQRIEALTTQLTVIDGTKFSEESGMAWINFGHERPTVRRRIEIAPHIHGVGPTYGIGLGVPAEQRTVLTANANPADVAIEVQDSGFWPRGGDGVHPLGYRLLIDPTGTPEIVEVRANDPDGGATQGTGLVSIVGAIVLAHVAPVVVRPLPGDFPTTAYPCEITLADGLGRSERVIVTGYDPDTDELEISAAPIGTFAVGDWVLYEGGVPELVEYTAKSGDNLLLAEPTVLAGGHRIGEQAELSPGYSVPDEEGWDYQLFLPPEPGWCFLDLLEYVKAYGVNVEVVTRR